ncbi:MAG: hypothetical protein IJS52_07975 [Bacilli bacterium]|jgi:hypothetical protein|nr:hypothetical protein [Bacilli bacterium]
MQILLKQTAVDKPEAVIVTDQYVDVNENPIAESVTDPISGETRTQWRYDVKRYSPNEYVKIVAQENEQLKAEVAEIRDALLEQIDATIGG